MSVILKTESELRVMARAGAVVDEVLSAVAAVIAPDVSTKWLDEVARAAVSRLGASPAFLGYPNWKRGGPTFPAALSVSVNEEVVHGVPGGRVLVEGDLVSIDFGCELDGFFADSARTIGVGVLADRDRVLMETTQMALQAGIDAAVVGGRLFDIGDAIQSVITPHGFGIVTSLTGHGVGRSLHELPEVANVSQSRFLFWKNKRLEPGLVLAIEPMVTFGSGEVVVEGDGWTVRTCDGSRAAHFEHTVAITKDGPIILTLKL